MHLDGARTVSQAVENLKKGKALGGLGSLTPQTQTADDQKPTVPFMTMQDKRRFQLQDNTTFLDTLKIVQESVKDSMFEGSKEILRHLDRIGEKLTNAVEDFQKKQTSSKDKRGRSDSRDNRSRRDRERSRSRSNGRGRNNDRLRSRERSRDRSFS